MWPGFTLGDPKARRQPLLQKQSLQGASRRPCVIQAEGAAAQLPRGPGFTGAAGLG